VNDAWPWLALALLGAYHGLNPAMGWLFAVALGLQERRGEAVLQALPPIATGHAVSVAVFVVTIAGVGLVADVDVLRLAGGLLLVAFGTYKFLRPMSHPRWVGMRLNSRDLALWSFLMSSAHGAGLMLLPALIALGHEHTHRTLGGVELPGSAAAGAIESVLAVLVHSAVMFGTMAVIAVAVYRWIGVTVLRTAWINLDVIWAVAIVATGVFTLGSLLV
jgi:hypothetical protein